MVFCLSSKDAKKDVGLMGFDAIVDTFYLDTFLLYEENPLIVTKPFSIRTECESIVFIHCGFNSTSDTLEIRAKASAGWVIPVYSRSPIPPNSYFYLQYTYLVLNHRGRVNTSILLQHKKKGISDMYSKGVIIKLRGFIE